MISSGGNDILIQFLTAPGDLAGSNSGLAASHNQAVILRTIRWNAPISRTELALRSGLSKQAVARITEKLIDDGFVVEARRRYGMRGQPAIELEINPEGCFAVGAGIGRDHLTIVAIDAVGTIRDRIHREERYMLPDDFFAAMKEALKTFRRRRAIDETRLAGIGIAIPDWLGEIPFIGMPPAYKLWRSVDIRERFSRLTDLPILIDNDATAAAIGELSYGLGAEIRSFFYIFFGSGLGGGLVLDGACYHGTTGISGEIGWLPVTLPDAPAGERIQPLGQVVSLFILYDFLAKHGVVVTRPQELLTLDARGKALLGQWLRGAAQHIAEAAIDIGLLINPDAVLIGGRIPVTILDELLLYVREALSRDPRPTPRIHRAAASEDAAALGAATMPLSHALRLESADPAQLTRAPLRGSAPRLERRLAITTPEQTSL
ncbi:sugar kinase [Kaistia sp. 32K]|uniref:ROK family transcriptional regulator n=1 Tax=Kaistia sp. 32K TaxID=2795690 RepID=UPI001916A571|nr:ROK family transcriptional regulator [Kaistia sp. 32K]BCP51410.1 sugar kinase [Kaistia sp. 32K]